MSCMNRYQNAQAQRKIDYDPNTSNRQMLLDLADRLGMTSAECRRRKFAGPCFAFLHHGSCHKGEYRPHMHGIHDPRG